jgi:hypothetical protein
MKMRKKQSASGISFVLLLAFSASGQIDWIAGESGTKNDLNAVTFGDNRFVAVGDSGTVITSEDGMTWERQETGVDAQLVDIAYGKGMYIAIGSGETIISSSNGMQWRKEESDSGTELQSITFGDSAFFLSGYYLNVNLIEYCSKFFISSDGAIWDSNAVDEDAIDIAYGDGKIVVLDRADTIISSSNGSEWNRQFLDAGENYISPSGFNPEDIYFLNNHFIVTGYEYFWHGMGSPSHEAAFAVISGDCVNWKNFYDTYEGDGNRIRTVCYGNGHYILVRYNTIYSKSDTDSDFVPRYSSSPDDGELLNASAASSDRCVFVGNKGAVRFSELSNAVNWDGRNEVKGGSIRASVRSDILTIRTAGVAGTQKFVEIRIYDPRGRAVMRKPVETVGREISVSLPQLACGIYRIEMKNSGDRYSTPLIIRQHK